MAQALTAAMPSDLSLDLNCSIVFEAVDPVTGAAVTGVTISNALLRVETTISASGDAPVAGPFQFIAGPAPLSGSGG